MSIFRSMQMSFYNIQIPKEYAFDVVSTLGMFNAVQLVDANPNEFHKPFTNSIRRCEESLHKIEILHRQLRDAQLDVTPTQDPANFLEKQEQILKYRDKSRITYLNDMEHEVAVRFQKIDELTKNEMQLIEKIRDLEDYKTLLYRAREVFYSKGDDENTKLTHSMNLTTVAGIISKNDILRFNKMIFRTTKGNSLMYTFDVPSEENITNNKTVFLIVLESGGTVLTKINRICDSFSAKKYPLPDNKSQYYNKLIEIDTLIADTKQLKGITEKNMRDSFRELIDTPQYGGFHLDCSRIEQFRLFFEMELVTYVNMNYLQNQKMIMVAHLWIAKDSFGQLLSRLPSFVNIKHKTTSAPPPTHFQLNDFTAPFQEIVDTYGTPRYGQVNPGLFAIAFFPFLFGVMFGDIGHGGVLLALGVYLCYDHSLKKSMPAIYNIRYLVLMMGTFAFFCGWIYNDFFSIPLNIFGSCYGDEPDQEGHVEKIPGCVYPFGLDPRWIEASNELNYFNSFKMKFAVIIGVAQMSLAIFLKMLNTIHFGLWLDFLFEWLPQQIFMFSTFGYMCLLIIKKWTIPWGIDVPTSSAPSIIGQMIAMPLKMGSTEGKPLWDPVWQEHFQWFLVKLSIVLIPIMLIPKPLCIWLKDQCLYRKPGKGQKLADDQALLADLRSSINTQAQEASEDNEHEQEHEFSEIVVHQIIQTIEFVLGSISNTASYLRLWALSLAHSQLSRVFFEKTVGGGIKSANIILLLVGFYIFFSVTLVVIMCMDSMECFLHALRLQWVEFQNKFFKADGWKFSPFSFKEIVKQKRVRPE